jgi:putative ABC transport system substrate-binding protein
MLVFSPNDLDAAQAAGEFLMMKRREFIMLIGTAATALPLAVRAQQAPGRPLIGVLSPLSPAAATRNIEALRAGLRDLGYVEGGNVTLALRFAGGVPARLPELAAELIALKPDVILSGSIGGILAARNATRTIPLIMMVISEDPVAMGLVSSIARPGGNITGVWMFGDDSLVGKRLEFLKHVVPGLARVGVIINPGDPISLRRSRTALDACMRGNVLESRQTMRRRYLAKD